MLYPNFMIQDNEAWEFFFFKKNIYYTIHVVYYNQNVIPIFCEMARTLISA